SLDRQLATHWPHEISGGQQQRVGLAGARAHPPSVLQLDHPKSPQQNALRALPRKPKPHHQADAGVASNLVNKNKKKTKSIYTKQKFIRYRG
ncbi:ABC transporter ATP-binding protein, partial [Enterobacter mori]